MHTTDRLQRLLLLDKRSVGENPRKQAVFSKADNIPNR